MKTSSFILWEEAWRYEQPNGLILWGEDATRNQLCTVFDPPDVIELQGINRRPTDSSPTNNVYVSFWGLAAVIL